MKERIIATLLCMGMVFSTGFTVLAEDQNQTLSENYQAKYISTLPTELSYDVTIRQIQEDISRYIVYNNLGIQYGTEEYVSLLQDFSYMKPEALSEDIRTYYAAYASIYATHVDFEVMLDKTLAEIRAENIRNLELATEIESTSVDSNSVQTRPRVAYNLEGAKQYAYAYAMIFNENYPQYGADCTNFASQILHEGAGFPTTSAWNVWAGPDSTGWFNWVSVGSFLQYWSLERGYIGKVCKDRDTINATAKPGDFLIYYNKTTYEYEHTQFVQSKVNGYIYCTQHSFAYYNEKLNDRMSASAFNNYNVYIVKFSN